MRSFVAWVSILVATSACATREGSSSNGLHLTPIEPPGTGGALGTGGTGIVFGAGGVGAGGFTIAGSGGAPVKPSYSRTCVEQRLSGSHDARPGTPPPVDASTSPTSPRDGGEKSDGRVDLQLGAGDLTLLVVFDKSGSMGDGWDTRSKWQVANEAFMQAIDPVIDNLTIGTIFFPQPDGCNVAPLDSPLQMNYAPGRSFESNWKETEANRAPNGSTPLELAFVYADMAIERGCGLGLLDDRFRVVLITDGEPTCEDDTNRVVELAGEWNRVGVETWVMGLPGSQAASALLDAIALAGGTDKAQMLGTPTALGRSLAAAAK